MLNKLLNIFINLDSLHKNIYSIRPIIKVFSFSVAYILFFNKYLITVSYTNFLLIYPYFEPDNVFSLIASNYNIKEGSIYKALIFSKD